SIVGTRPEHETLVLTMGAGGRPGALGPATVDVSLNDVPLGRVVVGAGMESFRFAIPRALASRMANSEDAARLQIASTTWNPRRVGGSNDDRDLGVVLERVAVL